jgi:hypothetical protein
MGVDPNGREFTLQVCRRRRVREIVSRVVYDWYAATTGGGERRVERQSPELLAQVRHLRGFSRFFRDGGPPWRGRAVGFRVSKSM